MTPLDKRIERQREKAEKAIAHFDSPLGTLWDLAEYERAAEAQQILIGERTQKEARRKLGLEA